VARTTTRVPRPDGAPEAIGRARQLPSLPRPEHGSADFTHDSLCDLIQCSNTPSADHLAHLNDRELWIGFRGGPHRAAQGSLGVLLQIPTTPPTVNRCYQGATAMLLAAAPRLP
jgi:hypothetical protein